MKIQHYAIIFIIIILPFSIICKSKVNNKIDTLNDETRINNVIDTATTDAVERLIELNGEYLNLFEGQTLNVTPAVAQNAIDVFFETLSINFNLPFTGDDFGKNYFSPYIPAIIIVAYDGFYVYSVENVGGEYEYVLSPKIPYSYSCIAGGKTWIINFTLGNYIKLYAPDGVLYKGEFQHDFMDETSGDYNELASILGNTTIKNLPQLTNDMSMIIYALDKSGDTYTYGSVPSFLTPETGETPIRADYSRERTDDNGLTATIDDDVSEFHRIRREAIINTIIATLNEKINNQNRYADMMGVTYDFYLPTIANDDWINAVDDISIMAFVQGIPVGPESYYNSYALGASRIIRTDYVYGITRIYNPNNPAEKQEYKIYHEKDCEYIQDLFDSEGNPIEALDAFGEPEVDVNGDPVYFVFSGDAGGVNYTLQLDETFIDRTEAAQNGYYPCMNCKP